MRSTTTRAIRRYGYQLVNQQRQRRQQQNQWIIRNNKFQYNHKQYHSNHTTNKTPPPPPPPSSPQWKKTATSFGVGTFAGILGSLAGMGGGFVMIPLMTSRSLGLNVSQHTAHGTSLFAVASTGLAGALGYGLRDAVDPYAAAAIAVTGIVSARFGARATTKLSEGDLKKALGVFMMCVAPLVPAKGFIARTYGESDGASHDDAKSECKDDGVNSRRVIPAAFIGLGSGFLAGLFGVGGGAVVVPALTIATDMTHYQALGTSLLAMALPAMSGTFTHFKRGNVAIRVAIPLACGSFIGAYAGSKMGLNISEDKLRWGFFGLMTTLGAKTLLKI